MFVEVVYEVHLLMILLLVVNKATQKKKKSFLVSMCFLHGYPNKFPESHN